MSKLGSVEGSGVSLIQKVKGLAFESGSGSRQESWLGSV